MRKLKTKYNAKNELRYTIEIRTYMITNWVTSNEIVTFLL